MRRKKKKTNHKGGMREMREGDQLQNHSEINMTIVSSKTWKRMTKTRGLEMVQMGTRDFLSPSFFSCQSAIFFRICHTNPVRKTNFPFLCMYSGTGGGTGRMCQHT